MKRAVCALIISIFAGVHARPSLASGELPECVDCKTLHISNLGHRTPLVFVFVHGLAMDENQFLPQSDFVTQMGFNSVRVVLNGHGQRKWSESVVTHVDWQQDVDRAVKRARELGDKLIMVGQSTGGMLSVMTAIRDPYSVSGLVLIEPAIRVSFAARNSACLLNAWGVKSTAGVASLFRSLGLFKETFREGAAEVSSRMGCEVTYLRSQIAREMGLGHLSEEDQTRAMAREIRIPLVMINNPSDLVVNPRHNSIFCSERYFSRANRCLKTDGNSVHGMITEDPVQATWISDTIRQFIIDHFSLEYAQGYEAGRAGLNSRINPL